MAKKKITPEVKYPEVTVKLVGTDGNVFRIIGKVKREIQRTIGLPAANLYMEEAMGCESYDKVLQLTMRTVNVE